MPLGYASYNMGGLGGYGRRPSALEALGLDPVQLTPEDEQSWLRQFASTALSGLSTVGNVLDTPGAAARSLLMGQNPLPGIFDPSLRPSGRDVLESWGALPENQPGFHPISNPMDALGDVAGFAGEVALDPLTYLSLGGSALSKGGQVAKNAGLLPDLARVSAGMGPREARLSTTLGDLLAQRVGETAPDVASRMEAVTRAAQGLGVDVSQGVTQAMSGPGLSQSVTLGRSPVLDQPIGALATFMGMPIGTGDTAKSIARGMDTLGRTARFGNIPGTDFSPGSAVARLFNAPTQEATSRIGQEVLAPEIFRGRNEARAVARGNVAQDVTDLVREGGKYAEDTIDASGALRRMFEGVDTSAPEVKPIIDRVRQRLDSMQAQAKEWGIRAPELVDTQVKYFPRYLSQLLKRPGGASQVASVFDPAQIGRQDVLRNIAGGTDTINKLTRSNPIQDLIEAGAKPKVIADEIANQFPQIESLYVKRGTTLRGPRSQAANLDPNIPGARTAIEIRNRHQDLATYLKSQGGAFRETGMFANHPMQDLAVREQNFHEAFDTSKRVLTALADDKLMQEAAKSPGRGKGVPLRRLLPKLGYDTDEALTKFASLKGMAASTPDDLKALGRIRVPTDLANDLARFHKGFTGPEAVGDIVGALDSVTNLFKAGVTTPWPAFHVRNLVSGQFQNWVSGQWSAESVKEANAILKGGDTQKLATIPVVKEILAQRGLGPEHAGDVVRELAYQHETTSRFHTYAADVVGKVPQGASLSSMKKDFAGGIGGSDPASLRKVGRQFVGLEKGTDWNPLNQRGIGGRVESTFAPAVAGQHLGGYIEGLNRLSPFIELLRRGVDPGEAAKRVAASQVDYSGRALTTFEREVMTRAFPFYKFCVPTDHEILTKSGWKTHDQLMIGEEVLALDHDTGRLKWTPLEAVNRFEHRGPLRKFEISRKHRKVRFLFTDHHRWPIVTDAKRRQLVAGGASVVGGIRKIKLGRDLKDGDRIPCAGDYRQRKSILTPRHAAILGWVLTDGHMRWRGGHCEMIVYQSPKKYLAEVVELLGTAARKPHPWSGVVAVPVALADAKAITAVLREKADLPAVATELSREAAEAMWRAMFMAEGTTVGKARRQHFAQSRKSGPSPVLDAFQILCILTGRTANLCQDGCTIKKRKVYRVTKQSLGEEHYEGVVWCPTTKYGTWVMRHDGAVVVTGNSRGIVPYTLRQLWEKPGGKLSQTIQATNDLRGNDVLTPDHVASTAAIPLGENDKGDPRFLTGLGLMHEDALSFMASPGDAGLEVLSRLNPIPKVLLEGATGRTFFQRGPEGGRPLEDLDPTVGRTISNVLGLEKPVNILGNPTLSRLAEQALANSPAARVLTTAKGLTDRRDMTPEGQGLKALNLLTGVRSSTVSERAQDAILRQRLEQAMKNFEGAKVFSKSYLPADALAELSRPQQQQALEIQALLDLLAQRGRERKQLAKGQR